MIKRKTSVYCLILLALLTLSGVILSVGEAQARYVNTVVWNTYVEPAADENALQYFTEDKSVTVVLGEMDVLGENDNAWYMVKLNIPGRTGATGSLTWGQVLTEGADPDIEVEMLLGNESLDQKYPLTMEEESDAQLTMVLQNKIRRQEDKTVYVTVTWDEIPGEGDAAQDPQTLTAVFRVILPAEEKIEEPSEEESSEPVTEAPTEEEPEEEESEEEESTEAESVEDETEETAADETEETTADETDMQTRTNPETATEDTDDGETNAPETENQEPSTEAPSEPPEENDDDPLPPMEIYLDSLSGFDPQNPLPVWITLESKAQVELGFAYYYDAASPAEMWPLPRYTRLSVDDGKTWLLMYTEDTMTLDLEAGTTTILMDLSAAQLDADIPRTLMVEARSETHAPGEASVGVTPMAESYTAASRILTPNTPLQLVLTNHWPLGTEEMPTGFSLTYTVERLTIAGSAEEGYSKKYEPVTLLQPTTAEGESPTEQTTDPEAPPALVAELNGQNLTIRADRVPPLPGTYRINMEWNYQGFCIANEQIAFYTNYINDTDSAQTGGAEQ